MIAVLFFFSINQKAFPEYFRKGFHNVYVEVNLPVRDRRR